MLLGGPVVVLLTALSVVVLPVYSVASLVLVATLVLVVVVVIFVKVTAAFLTL